MIPTTTHSDDLELFKKAAYGDNKAAQTILGRYQKPLQRFLYRLTHNWDDVLDLTQETYMRALEHIDTYEDRKNGCIKSWLFKIAHRTQINHFRNQQKTKNLFDTEQDFLENLEDRTKPTLPEQIRQQAHNDLTMQLTKALDRNNLPPLFEQTLKLYHHDALNYEEIATLQNVPEGTVKSRLHRARQTLKKDEELQQTYKDYQAICRGMTFSLN